MYRIFFINFGCYAINTWETLEEAKEAVLQYHYECIIRYGIGGVEEDVASWSPIRGWRMFAA